MGARLRCASETSRTMCASRVSLPTRSARIRKLPEPFTVPPVTRSPVCFSTGMGSPVTSDSSIELEPSTIKPSVATFSPGRTRTRSPTVRRSRGTSCSLPSSPTTRAVLGASPNSPRMALLVWARARSSSTWPSRTRVVITADASKYTGTSPPAPRNDCGKPPGMRTAARL